MGGWDVKFLVSGKTDLIYLGNRFGFSLKILIWINEVEMNVI